MMASGAYFFIGVQPQKRASLPCFVGSQGLSSGPERFFKQSLEEFFSETYIQPVASFCVRTGAKRWPGYHGGQAGYADILLLGKIIKRWEVHDGPLWGRSIKRGCRRTHSPDGPFRTGPP